MRPAIPISEALADRHLLGEALGDVASWRTWVITLKAAFGLPLDAHERETFRAIAGDRLPPAKRVRELWAGPIGRRSGKSRIAAAIAVHMASLTDHRHQLVPGETGVVAVIAASREQAGTVFGYVRGFLQASPLLAGEVESIGRDDIMLRGGICISVVTNSFRLARGMTLLAVVGDEVSYRRDESAAEPDIETYRAVLPSLVASGGLFVGISTGYRRHGLLFEKYRDHFGLDVPLVQKRRYVTPKAAKPFGLGRLRVLLARLGDQRRINRRIKLLGGARHHQHVVAVEPRVWSLARNFGRFATYEGPQERGVGGDPLRQSTINAGHDESCTLD
jgi:hypothetical protein